MQQVSGYILIKLAARCNLNCSYCYWFRDASVYEKPVIIEDRVLEAFLEKLEYHIVDNKVPKFQCIFHGGEPLMYNAKKFEQLLVRLEEIRNRTMCKLTYSITTNGVLVNENWCKIFKKYGIRVAVSIDGPQEVHDRKRPKLTNKGSYADSVRGYELLRRHGLEPSILAVCDPLSDPISTIKHFVEDLGVKYCDILIPDMTFDDLVEPVSDYYIKLFDHWYEHYFNKGVHVRFLVGLIRGVLELGSSSDSFGYTPVHTVSLLTDGSLEPLDVLRIAGYASTKTSYNILRDNISDVRKDANWQNAYDSSLKLCRICENCEFKIGCGGGHLSQRWSKHNGYDNPSIYCNDFKRIFRHVADKVSADIKISQKQPEAVTTL